MQIKAKDDKNAVEVKDYNAAKAEIKSNTQKYDASVNYDSSEGVATVTFTAK